MTTRPASACAPPLTRPSEAQGFTTLLIRLQELGKAAPADRDDPGNSKKVSSLLGVLTPTLPNGER